MADNGENARKKRERNELLWLVETLIDELNLLREYIDRLEKSSDRLTDENRTKMTVCLDALQTAVNACTQAILKLCKIKAGGTR